MKEKINNLLKELQSGLEKLYCKRLRGVYLFGSYARQDNDQESDFDVLIVLDAIGNYGLEVNRTGYLISELSLEYGVSVSRVFVAQDDWIHSNTPFIRNVRGEAVPS